MSTPHLFTQHSNLQQIEPGLSVHSSGDSNISSDLTIIGDVASSGSVTLDGAIEGNIRCLSLTVTENGRVNGGIVASQEVTVQGVVSGTIRGRRVMLQKSAKVDGDIFHQGIGIEMGTRYDGTLRWAEDDSVFHVGSQPERSAHHRQEEEPEDGSMGVPGFHEAY